jgi:hypothetical protein
MMKMKHNIPLARASHRSQRNHATERTLQWVLRLAAYALLPSERALAGRLGVADVFFELRPATQALNLAFHIEACNVFLNWFKVVFFLYHVPVFGLLLGTMAKAAPTLAGFLVVFFVVFLGFAQVR